MSEGKYIVYILECADGSYYTGYTVNINRRMAMHEQGKASKYTRSRRPLKLVHQEKYESKSDALKREYAIKQLTRAEKKILVEGGEKDNVDSTKL
ncbi:putative endonuclease [Scopulibacillus daqui]|uniref:Endonuclease n=1 Tax=Scopulibacillus daqui TaxID=1469162 RepID=A0ABS2Q2H1_9BACL|nr:GIY-YIG nuclease family protein [Scopulibacillus daqui]MBM7646479.1 putative endonuclease [Scopulibacillus daqui]